MPKDKTSFTSLNYPLCTISRILQGGVLSKVIPRDTTSDTSSDILTKQVVAIVDYTMMLLAKVRNFCLSRMKGVKVTTSSSSKFNDQRYRSQVKSLL